MASLLRIFRASLVICLLALASHGSAVGAPFSVSYDWTGAGSSSTGGWAQLDNKPGHYTFSTTFGGSQGLWVWPTGSLSQQLNYKPTPTYGGWYYQAPGSAKITAANIGGIYHRDRADKQYQLMGLDNDLLPGSELDFYRDWTTTAAGQLDGPSDVGLAAPQGTSFFTHWMVTSDDCNISPRPESKPCNLLPLYDYNNLPDFALTGLRAVDFTLDDPEDPHASIDGSLKSLDGQWTNSQNAYSLSSDGSDSSSGLTWLELTRETDGNATTLAQAQIDCDYDHASATYGARNCPMTASTSTTVDLGQLGEGDHYFYAQAVDNSDRGGSSPDLLVRIDRTAPETPPDLEWREGNMGAGLAWSPADDNLSGPDHYQWQAGTNNGQAVCQSGTVNDDGIANEFKTPLTSQAQCPIQLGDRLALRVRAIDQAGNVGEWSSWIDGVIDRPTVTAERIDSQSGQVTPLKDGAWIGGYLQLQADARDIDGSGIGEVHYRLDGGQIKSCADIDSDPFPCLLNTAKYSDGQHTLSVTAYDRAEDQPHERSENYTLAFDNTAPAAPTNLDYKLSDGVMNVSWNPPSPDGGAPIAFYQYRYSIGGGPYSEWVKSVTSSVQLESGQFEGAEKVVFEVRAFDEAGNGSDGSQLNHKPGQDGDSHTESGTGDGTPGSAISKQFKGGGATEKSGSREAQPAPPGVLRDCLEPPPAKDLCRSDGCRAVASGTRSKSSCNGAGCVARAKGTRSQASCNGTNCKARATGTRSKATAKGTGSSAKCVGKNCRASTSGKNSRATASGKSSRATSKGKNSTARAKGKNSVARCTGKGCDAKCSGAGCKAYENGKLVQHSPPAKKKPASTGGSKSKKGRKASINEGGLSLTRAGITRAVFQLRKQPKASLPGDGSARGGSRKLASAADLADCHMNVWIRGVEVTQGISGENLFDQVDAPHAAGSVAAVQPPTVDYNHDATTTMALDEGQPATPQAARLVGGRRAFVRIYLAAQGVSGAPHLTVGLTGPNGEHATPINPTTFEPISKAFAARAPATDIRQLRGNLNASATYLLPTDWTQPGRNITLKATVDPPAGSKECQGCGNDNNDYNTFTVTNVLFTDVRSGFDSTNGQLRRDITLGGFRLTYPGAPSICPPKQPGCNLSDQSIQTYAQSQLADKLNHSTVIQETNSLLPITARSLTMMIDRRIANIAEPGDVTDSQGVIKKKCSDALDSFAAFIKVNVPGEGDIDTKDQSLPVKRSKYAGLFLASNSGEIPDCGGMAYRPGRALIIGDTDDDGFAHELGHNFGLSHASGAHGEISSFNQPPPESWPDFSNHQEQTSSGPVAGHGGLLSYAVPWFARFGIYDNRQIAGGEPLPNPYNPDVVLLPGGIESCHAHDFMSYGSRPANGSKNCANSGDNTPLTNAYWTSIKNWDRLIDRMQTGAIATPTTLDHPTTVNTNTVSAPAVASDSRNSKRNRTKVLRPLAFAAGIGGTKFVGSGKQQDRIVDVGGRYYVLPDGSTTDASFRPLSEIIYGVSPTPPAGDGTHRIIGKDASGNVVIDQPVAVNSGGVAEGSAPSNALFQAFSINLRLPESVRRLEFVRGSEVIMSRDASAHVPKVKMLLPRKGEIWRGRTSHKISWQIDDPDPGREEINSGLFYRERPNMQWRFGGGSFFKAKSSVKVNSLAYEPGKRVQFLLSVTDGWHTAQALSPFFTVEPRKLSPEDIVTFSVAPVRKKKSKRISYREPGGYFLKALATDPNGSTTVGSGPDKTKTYLWYKSGRAVGKHRKLIGKGSELLVRRLLNRPGTVRVTVVVKDKNAGTASKSVILKLRR